MLSNLPLTTFFDHFSGVHFVILGLGREGWSSYQFLQANSRNSVFLLIDDKPLSNLADQWQIASQQSNVTFMTSEQALRHPGWATPQTVIIKTPGLPLHHPIVKFIHQNMLQVTSNTDLLYQVIETLPPQEIKILGVTGTKGKSTTTSFIHHVLVTADLPVVIGGNIGLPPLDCLPKINTLLTTSARPIWIVLEQSCHQLDDLRRSPDVAVIQHIVPEHLDYYPDFDRYMSAKSSIARYQNSTNVVIARSSSATAWQIATLSVGRHLDSTPDPWLSGTDLVWRKTGERLCKLEEIPLKGMHNLENLIPGLLLAEELGLDVKLVRQAVMTFQPLPHRLQTVGVVDAVTYVNDSLATVPDAAVAALSSFSAQHAILIAGGYDRHQDFTPLAEWIIQHGLRGLLLFAPTGQRLEATLRTLSAKNQITLESRIEHMNHVEHMADAVEAAHRWAQPGDIVLLSPASASFGEFKDYADRGNQFATEVKKLLISE